MPDNPTALRKKLLENRMEQMRRQWARPKGLEATLSIVIALATAIAAIAAVAFLCWVMPPLVAQISDWAAQTHDCKGIWRTRLSYLPQCESAPVLQWLSAQTQWLIASIPHLNGGLGNLTLSDLLIGAISLAFVFLLACSLVLVARVWLGWCGDTGDALAGKLRGRAKAPSDQTPWEG